MTTAPVRDASRAGALLVAAVLLTAVNLRTAVISVGPVLDELEAGVGLSSFGAGLLTTLPVLGFALLGALTPRLARRHGERRVLCGALLLMTVSLLARVLVGNEVAFLLLTVPALAGGAIGNVLLPVLVKRHFPQRIGAMTAAYTTALATGTTAAAALTVPLASLRGHGIDWRLGLGVWAVPAAVGALVWVRPAVRDRPVRAAADAVRPAVHRSRTAWALALFFGAQSMQAYISFGWFALYFRERAGASATRAGLYVAVLAAVAVPVSAVVPAVAARFPDQRRVLAALVVCYVASYTGMGLSPGGAPLLWMVLAGLGGGTFPLALTMIGLRTRTTAGTASTSAFVQSVGYVVAGGGPLLVGVLHGATGGWTWPFVLLFADLALMAVAGWYAAQPRYVEDDLRE